MPQVTDRQRNQIANIKNQHVPEPSPVTKHTDDVKVEVKVEVKPEPKAKDIDAEVDAILNQELSMANDDV